MKRFYCNGKKGYCERGNDNNIDCKNCDFANGAGGEIVDVPDTNYDRIKNMSVEEMADFICDIYSCNEHKEIRVNGIWILPEEIEQWLESEVTE